MTYYQPDQDWAERQERLERSRDMIEKHRKEVDGSRAPNGSQWIEWKGGECPVAGDQEVVIRVREEPSAKLRLAKDCRWEHATERDGFYSARDIIAYRLVEPLLETGAPSRDWVEFRQQADRGEHPLPPAAPAATPRTESGEWPTPEYAQRIMFEGCDSVVMAPEDYEALYELARTLERENADLRGKLEQAQKGYKKMEFLCLFNKGEAEKQHERAEVAEAKLATARADERERCAKMLEARAESVEGPTNAYAVGELYEAALAIRALKEASNG